MARRARCCGARECQLSGELRKSLGLLESRAVDPLRKWSVHCSSRDDADLYAGSANNPRPCRDLPP